MIKFVVVLCCISFVLTLESVKSVDITQIDADFIPEVELVGSEMNNVDALWTAQTLQLLLFQHGEDLSERMNIFWHLNEELKNRFADGNNWNIFSFSDLSYIGQGVKLNWYISGKFAIFKTKNYYLEIHVPATNGGKPN